MADDLEPAASGRNKVMKNGNAEIDYAFAGDFTPLLAVSSAALTTADPAP
jgi:hypothetical protein